LCHVILLLNAPEFPKRIKYCQARPNPQRVTFQGLVSRCPHEHAFVELQQRLRVEAAQFETLHNRPIHGSPIDGNRVSKRLDLTQVKRRRVFAVQCDDPSSARRFEPRNHRRAQQD
jgi:hypothetical protein